MNNTVIGCGAAGTKGLIHLIEQGIVPKNKAHIINSTTRDVPAEYKDISIIICENERTGGCGKEREAGKALMENYIKENNFDVSSLVDPMDDVVTIIAAPEGGTGSGASVVLAQELNKILPVHIFTFNGFEDDPRGIKNTVNYFKDLQEDYIIEAISNKKFLKETGSRIRAEAAANQELANRLMVYEAIPIVESAQNIDSTDHYKTITRPGFMDIELIELDKVKNIETMHKVLQDAVDNTHSIDFVPSAGIIAVYINASDHTADLVTASFDHIKEMFGMPFEIFHHIQNEGDKEWVAIIASGIKIPIDEIEAIYKKYIAESQRVDKSKETFFGAVSKMNDIDEDANFNIKDRRRGATSTSSVKEIASKTIKPIMSKQTDNGKFTQTVRIVEGEDVLDKY